MAQKLYENIERLFSVQPASNVLNSDIPPQPIATPQPTAIPEPTTPPTAPPISLPETLQRVQGQ